MMILFAVVNMPVFLEFGGLAPWTDVSDDHGVLLTSHSRRRRMLLKINDLSYRAFANLKSIESTTYAFYATSNGQVLN